MLKEKEFCITHNGKFHADDVFSAAFIKHVFGKDIDIYRCGRIPDWMKSAALIIFDIGGGKFDHHDKNNLQYRDNGIPYASFGLLWRHYAPYMFSMDIVKKFDYVFIQNLDRTDNGGDKNIISQTVSAMNPVWDDDTENNSDTAFLNAVDWAYDILNIYFKNFNAEMRAERFVQSRIKIALEKGEQILLLEKGMPFFKGLNNVDEIKFVVSPSSRGGWNLRAISRASEPEVYLVPFPEEWLEHHPEGCHFMHSKMYLAVFDTRENAIAAGKDAIKHWEDTIAKERTIVEYEKVG